MIIEFSQLQYLHDSFTLSHREFDCGTEQAPPLVHQEICHLENDRTTDNDEYMTRIMLQVQKAGYQ